MSIQYRHWNLKSQSSYYGSPPLTSRTGLPPKSSKGLKAPLTPQSLANVAATDDQLEVDLEGSDFRFAKSFPGF